MSVTTRSDETKRTHRVDAMARAGFHERWLVGGAQSAKLAKTKSIAQYTYTQYKNWIDLNLVFKPLHLECTHAQGHLVAQQGK